LTINFQRILVQGIVPVPAGVGHHLGIEAGALYHSCSTVEVNLGPVRRTIL
jgi:hypothetical protein